MGRHSGRTDRQTVAAGTAGSPAGVATAVAHPPGPQGPTGLNTPAGGLPDPETWWRTPEIIPPPALPAAGPPLPRMWWDEAPVAPPVVVAAADPSLVGSTGSIAMPPPAAGDVPPAPAAMVAPAPSLGGPRTRRELHRPRRGTARRGPAAPLADGASELVRPYVTGSIPLAEWVAVDEPSPAPAGPVGPVGGGTAGPDGTVEPALRGAGQPGDERALRPSPVMGRSRRAREGRDTLGTHLTPPTGLTGLLGGAAPEAPGSLFEAVRRPEVLDVPSPWAAPAGPALPSRKELRTRERQVDSTRAVATRKLARTGVLAVTAFGVVASGGPAALSALGVDLTGSTASAGQAMIGQGGAPSQTLLFAAPAGADQVERSDKAAAAQRLAVALQSRRLKQADRDKRDGKALAGAAKAAAKTLADVAADAVRAEAERKAEIAAQALRNVIRDPRAYARTLVEARGWSSSQFTCLDLLWKRESGWNYRAQNSSSGAYGIPQALPGSKMAGQGTDWRTNPATQIKWGLNYIAGRYGTPCAAWAHSESSGWY